MGTSSTALFSDDMACDVRDEFVELLSRLKSSKEATESMVKSWASSIQDVDDAPTFWLALAATQWKYGCLTDAVRARAIEVVDSGSDLRKWSGASITRRNSILRALKEKLISSQPAASRPRRRKTVITPSVKVQSPDGRGLATTYELPNSMVPDAPRMQVTVQLLVGESRGGGGVFVADCEYNEVVLEWLDAETLQIFYPTSARVSSKSTSLFHCGRTIRIACIARGA